MSEEAKVKQKPHLALTHLDKQGGSANGRNVSLLLKSDVEIDDETAQLIEKLSGVKVEVNKSSYSSRWEALNKAIAKFKRDKWEYAYVIDFDDNMVVFCVEDRYWAAEYTTDGSTVTVSDQATEVSRFISYVESSGKVALTEIDGTLDGDTVSLVVKSLDTINKDEKLLGIFKSKEKEKVMEKEIEKAVNERTEVLKADLKKAQEELQEALAEIQKMREEAQERKVEVRKSALSKVVEEGELETLLKGVATMDDDAFDILVKSLEANKEKIEKSDLFSRQSGGSDIEKVDEVPDHIAILKKKYGKANDA